MFLPATLLLFTGVAFSSANIAKDLSKDFPVITKAAVFDLKSNSLGYTRRFSPTTHEAQRILSAFDSRNPLQNCDLFIDGKKYNFHKRDSTTFVTSQSITTIVLEKTNTLVLISLCQTNHPQSCVDASKKFANKLRAKGQ